MLIEYLLGFALGALAMVIVKTLEKPTPLPKDYVSNIDEFSFKKMQPILGGHLQYSVTLRKSWGGNLATGIDVWVHISTEVYEEKEKYNEKLIELGFVQGERNERYYSKALCLDELNELRVKLREG